MSDRRFEVAAHCRRQRDHDHQVDKLLDRFKAMQSYMFLHVPCRTGQEFELAGIGAEQARRVSANEALSRTTRYSAESLDLLRECCRADRRRDHGGGVRARRGLPGLPRDNEGAGAGYLCGSTARDRSVITSLCDADTAGSGAPGEAFTAHDRRPGRDHRPGRECRGSWQSEEEPCSPGQRCSQRYKNTAHLFAFPFVPGIFEDLVALVWRCCLYDCHFGPSALASARAQRKWLVASRGCAEARATGESSARPAWPGIAAAGAARHGGHSCAEDGCMLGARGG